MRGSWRGLLDSRHAGGDGGSVAWRETEHEFTEGKAKEWGGGERKQGVNGQGGI